MDGNSAKDIQRRLWRRFTGNPGEFSVENRAFNYIIIISFFLLLYYLFFSLYLRQFIISTVVVVLLGVLAVLYYYSRYKKKYQAGIVIYALCSYATITLNYFINSGISGPSICLFFLTFQLLIAIGKPRQHIIWIILHVGIFISLLVIEYTHPWWVPDTYLTRSDRFIDIGSNFLGVIAFSFAITNYLRSYLNNKRKQAEQTTRAMIDINKQITVQNQALEKVNREKNKLFSIVSHDLKSPLDAIMGYLELLTGTHLAPDDKLLIEQQLLEQTRYTSDLLVNLLSWARSQMGGVNVHLAALNLKELVDKTANAKISAAAKKTIKLTYSIDPNLEVIADMDMLHIIMRNLVTNAIKFTRPGGEIFIRAARKDSIVEISVQDTGIGIPKEKQAAIFSLKTESTFGTDNEKGIGLGLMMCRDFINYQNGNIWFESTPNVGTTFYISLPVALR